MDIPHVIYSWTFGHLSCFHILTILSNAAANTQVQVFVWMYVFISLGYTPRTAIAGSYNISVFDLVTNFQTIF